MNYREHFKEEKIKKQMEIQKGITYLKAKKIIEDWKKSNKKKYEIEFDDYMDEINQFK